MENTDNQCFKWCIARGLNSVERDSDQITKIFRKQAGSLNFKGLEFPMNLKDIGKFERLNLKLKLMFLDMKRSVFTSWEYPSSKEKKRFASFFSRTNTIVLLRIFQDLFRSRFQNIMAQLRFVIGILIISQTRKPWKSMRKIVRTMKLSGLFFRRKTLF